MRDTTLLQFKIKNTRLAYIMQLLPVRTTADKQNNYSFVPFPKGQPWYCEKCIHLDIPQGGSIAQWFFDLLSNPNNEIASLYRYEEYKNKAVQSIAAKGTTYYDEGTIAAEIEVCNICCESGEDCSSYAYEKRTETETTIIRLSAVEWRKCASHGSFAEALSGETSQIRQYAKKIGNIKTVLSTSELTMNVVENSLNTTEQLPYIAALAKPEDWNYKVLKKGKIQLIAYMGSDETVYVPESIDGQTVTELGEKLFFGKTFIKRVVMPDTVEVLKASQFGYGVKLDAIRLSQNLKDIGMQAFSGVALSTLDIPESVTHIKGGALDSYEIQTVIIRGNPVFSTNLRVFGWDPKAVVYGHKGGSVETYCRKMGIRFIAL